MSESLPARRSQKVLWILIVLAFWAFVATFWAVVLQQRLQIQKVEFHKKQYELEQKMLPPLIQVVNELHGPVKNGARPPIATFSAWIPLARTTELPSGNIEYQWHTKSSDGCPTFFVVESDPDQRVTKIDVFSPEW